MDWVSGILAQVEEGDEGSGVERLDWQTRRCYWEFLPMLKFVQTSRQRSRLSKSYRDDRFGRSRILSDDGEDEMA